MKNLSTKFRTSLFVFAALISTTLIGTTTVAHSAEKIAWKFKAKQMLNYKITIETKMVMNAPGAPGGGMPPMLITQDMDVFWTIDKVNKDGSCQMSQMVKRIIMSANADPAQPKPLIFDSANPNVGGNNPILAAMAKPILALVGEKNRVTMAAHGEVTKIELSKNFLKAVKKPVRGGGHLGGISEEMLIGLIRQSCPAFPKKAVSIKDKWENKATEKNILFALTIKNHCQYIGAEKQGKNSYVKIQITPTMTLDKKVGRPAMALTLKTQSGAGTILFDVANGVMKSHVSKQYTELKTAMGGQTIVMILDKNMDMQLIPPKK